jgi:hypothetical protein
LHNMEESGSLRLILKLRHDGVDFKPLAMEMFGATSDIFLKFIKTLAKDAAEINDTPYCTTFSYWQKRLSTTLQRYNAKVLQQSQYKIARVTGLLHEDHITI